MIIAASSRQMEPLFSFSCANVDGNRLKSHNLGKKYKVSHNWNDPIEAVSKFSSWAVEQVKDLILLVCLDENLSRLISVVQTWFHSDAGSWIN